MRFLYHLLRGYIAGPQHSTASASSSSLLKHEFHSRIGLLDLDANFHANNSSLLLITEFARWNYLAQTRVMLHEAVRRKWAFMIGSQAVRYRHQLYPWQKYRVDTELVAMDHAWLWVRHRIVVADGSERIAAFVLARIIVKQGRETVPPIDFLRLIHEHPEQVVSQDPHAHDDIKGFLQWDAYVKREQT